jgi:hypothetical protein
VAQYGAVIFLRPVFRLSETGKTYIRNNDTYKLILILISEHANLVKSSRELVDHYRKEIPDFDGDDDEAVAQWTDISHKRVSDILVHIIDYIAGRDLGQWARQFFNDRPSFQRIIIEEEEDAEN